MEKIEKIYELFNQLNYDELTEGLRTINDREQRLLIIKLTDLKLGLAQEKEVGRELF